MKKEAYFILFQILCLKLIDGWDQVFQYIPCYQAKMEQRMSLSIDNLIAIIEGYERENVNTAPEMVADALLNRYRRNGIVFQPESKNSPWTVLQFEESFKQDLDDKLLKPSAVVPEDTFQPREECSIHMSLSHSTDYYPHRGVDYIWENNYFRRKKRSSYPNLPSDMDPAEHPVEFGVIQTSAGPVSGGFLIAGIRSSSLTRSYSVEELIDTYEVSKLPEKMLEKKVKPFYGVTISGLLAKAAILTRDTEFEVGPIGMFGNCSACPRLYSLENNDIYYLTRAELFGAMDGFIIGLFLQSKSTSQSVTLSEILRMYYGDRGLLDTDLRACNRMEIYKQYKSNVISEIKDQALNYMYAFQNYFPNVANPVQLQSDDIDTIERVFQDQLDEINSAVESFINSYSYDDPGYYSCPSIRGDDYKYETEVDLVVIYSPSGSSDDIKKQLEYIGLTARRVGVGYDRSRIAVYNGKDKVPLPRMTNYSNIADYVCNYTTKSVYSGASSENFVDILDYLSEFYNSYYSKMSSYPDLSGKNSQVVLWNLPSSFEGDEDEMLRDFNKFNLTYPDVTFMFVGSKSTELLSFLGGQKEKVISISTSSDNPIDISTDIVNEIKKAPRMFYYPACDTQSEEYSDFKESNHVYRMYVSPNFSTIVKIPPQAFHYSETLTLTIDSNDFRVCVSRTKLPPTENDCKDDSPPYEFKFQYLCNQNVSECSAIYILVTGNSDARTYCSDDYCIYPDQIEFEMTHEGMICSGNKSLPYLLLIFIVSLMVIKL